jgi:hypothetical protein
MSAYAGWKGCRVGTSDFDVQISGIKI